MNYRVQFAPQAQAQLDQLEDYIGAASLPVLAARYVDAIVAHCENLASFPLRGRLRDDLMPGLRTTNYHGRVVIAYLVNSDAGTVSIVGVFYGGQDYETFIEDELTADFGDG